MAVELVPTRWWQAIEFIRTDFETARGRDPWVDQVLSRPWSPSSLLEYAYGLAEMPFSLPHFVVVSGERVGTLWLTKRSRLLYILSLGLLPHFRANDESMQVGRLLIKAVRCIEDCAKQFHSEVTVARIAACNTPIQRMVKIFGGKPLGLATTTLTLSTMPPSPALLTIGVRKIGKTETAKAWRYWKLQAVARVAGSDGVKAASDLLDAFSWIDPLPKGEHFALYQGDRATGLAFVHQHEGDLELGLLTATMYWSGPQTAELVGEMIAHMNSPIRYLTLTQRHADILDGSAPFDFERNREQERHFVFWMMADYFANRPRRGN
jgi:hypothetical protein